MSDIFQAELTEIESDTLNHVTFVCPYERYKKMKPFVQSQEAEAAAAAISNKAVPTVNGDKQDVDVDNEQRIQRVYNNVTYKIFGIWWCDDEYNWHFLFLD